MLPKFERHPLSAAWPDLNTQDRLLLRESLQKGLANRAIVLYQGMVLDGWQLYQLCLELGLAPKVLAYRGDDPAGFVAMANDARRHATIGQRVHARVLMAQWIKPYSEKGNLVPQQNTQQLSKIAKETKASEKTVKQSRKVARKGTQKLNDAVRDGTISAKAAAAIADLPPEEQDERVEAIAKGEKPKAEPKPEITYDKCPNRGRCNAQAVIAEMEERYQDLVDVAKTQDALMSTDPALEMRKLREENRRLIRRRDELMAQASEMRGQIRYWEGQAKRLGWKPQPKSNGAAELRR